MLALLAAGLASCAHTPFQPAPRKNAVMAGGQGLLGADAEYLTPGQRRQALAAEYKALEHNKAGQTVSWGDARGEASGTVTPGQPYQVGAQNCRQYSHDWKADGVPHTARGSACRNADGSWTTLN